MRVRRILAVLLLISLFLLPVLPVKTAGAATPYSEKLTVYIAGSDAYWQLRLSGINASNSVLSAVESTPGLNWYNVTMIKTTSWGSDFQVFGSGGYNLLPVPYVSPQAIYLDVGASSYAAALSVANDFGPYFASTFSSLSNSTGDYVFYSPVAFTELAPTTLLTFVPSSVGGFASVISVANFTALQSPIVTLEGDSGPSGFTHTLTLSSITSSALTDSETPAFLSYFGTSDTYMQAANSSTSSVIDVNVLDGLLTPSGPAAANVTGVTNDRQDFSSSYVLSLAPGTKARSLNVSVTQSIPEVLVSRQVDTGVLRQGDKVSVTISLTDLSTSADAYEVNFTDNWWKSYSFLNLTSHNSTVTYAVLKPGETVTPTYTLEDVSNVTQQVSVPPATVSYLATVGAKNETFYSDSNGLTLSFGTDQPVVYAYLASSSSTGYSSSVGTPQSFNLVVTNVGTRTADGVYFNGKEISSGLTSDGGSVTVPVSVSPANLAANNVSATYTVLYNNGGSVNATAQTNLVHVVFSHTTMSLAFAILTVNATESTPAGKTWANLTLSYTVDNNGDTNVTSFAAQGNLPSGVSCGMIHEANLSCSDGVLGLKYGLIPEGGEKVATMSINLTQPANIIFPPLTFSSVSSNYTQLGGSNSEGIAAGVVLSKSFTPDQLFGGMDTAVSLQATNEGPHSVYNITLQSTADSFDFLPVGAAPTHTFNGTLPAGGVLSASYNLTTYSASTGTLKSDNVTATFFYAGEEFYVSRFGASASIYSPLSVAVSSVPGVPTEGKAFEILVTITNPSKVNVTDATFVLPIPNTISIINSTNATFSHGELTVSAAAIPAGGDYNATAFASTGSGINFPFASSKLTFDYFGKVLTGSVPSSGGISISENVTTRYLIPVAIAVVVMLAFVIVVRRAAKPAPSAPASQK